ncbi:Gingipain R2 precursor [Novipirellula aureliae]|uniref:Gingipain R2 n=1 Tax=Novipirellula aureliae TaxID=2527966 RepID=A0A5C6EB22_9BACT|nr:C25 family cysteine peptidase [Novipirellula aureliae]TWU44369.1 Gingipain R2 precursor [Novipirellula aureliae]
MMNWHSKSTMSSVAVSLAALLLASVDSSDLIAAERTLSDFKAYAAERLPQLGDTPLDRFVRMVDKDGDGVISDVEFDDRLATLQKLSQSSSQPEPIKSTSETATGMSPSTVLLITSDELAAAWEPFAIWKTRNGKATKIVTIGQIQQQYEADGIQEKIRLCVRHHIDNHKTRWVVLGGDCEPDGKGLVPGGHTTVHAQERSGIPTDIVYLSETDWDADEDGIYGEWEEDREAISYPDGTVGLGRVPVRSAADVAAFTDKVIAYESHYPTSDFAKQMIYTCTDSPAYPKVRNSWDGYVSKVWEGGQAGRFFSAETPWDEQGSPGSHQLSADNLVALINAKTTGKLHIHGHGLLPLWALEDSKFTAQHVNQLSNETAYPLITTVSCFTGQYDGKEDPSIVESMIRQPKGGSVAIVAPIRTGKPHVHQPSDFRRMVSEGKLDGTTQTMTRYWSNGLGSGLTTGEALMKAKADMVVDAQKTAGYHLCICELNLLGDPTLDMRANIPRSPKLECPSSIATGKQSVEVITDAPGSTVCLWKGNEVYIVTTTDADGKAKCSIEPTSAGNLSVTVSGTNLNSVMKSISVNEQRQ